MNKVSANSLKIKEQIIDYLKTHGPTKTEDVVKAVGIKPNWSGWSNNQYSMPECIWEDDGFLGLTE